MAFTSRTGTNAGFKDFLKPRKWKDWKSGEFLEGIILECNEKDKYKKPIFLIKVTDSNFSAVVGSEIALNCGGNFKNQMDLGNVGEKVKISYGGETKILKGEFKGELTHVIKVEFDEESGAADELI